MYASENCATNGEPREILKFKNKKKSLRIFDRIFIGILLLVLYLQMQTYSLSGRNMKEVPLVAGRRIDRIKQELNVAKD